MSIAPSRLTWILAVLIGALLAFALLAAAPGGSPLPAPSASAADKDCSDFESQKKAQKFFKKHNPKDDPHGLDADNDGLACENNPCPCVAGVKSDRAGAGSARKD